VNWDVDKPRDQWLFDYPAQVTQICFDDCFCYGLVWFDVGGWVYRSGCGAGGQWFGGKRILNPTLIPLSRSPNITCTQVVLTGTQIYWTEEAERALEEYEGGQEDAVKRYLQVGHSGECICNSMYMHVYVCLNPTDRTGGHTHTHTHTHTPKIRSATPASPRSSSSCWASCRPGTAPRSSRSSPSTCTRGMWYALMKLCVYICLCLCLCMNLYAFGHMGW
jgi:hypothetical protein